MPDAATASHAPPAAEGPPEQKVARRDGKGPGQGRGKGSGGKETGGVECADSQLHWLYDDSSLFPPS
eukprot:8371105-Pyramimonas_sp.AAC.1